MSKLRIELASQKEQVMFGLWMNSKDRSISSDIKILSQKYHAAFSSVEGSVLPYFVLSRNYDEQSGSFELLVGSTIEKESLETLILPAGDYAQMTVRPKLGVLWGSAIGQAKRFFYKNWLPASSYQGLNMEYELHTEKSTGKHPSIALLFAIQAKA